MQRIELSKYRETKSQADVAKEFALTQPAISHAERKGRRLYIEFDGGVKRLVEIRIIREVAA